MLTKAQEKLIKSLHTKKGREKSGLCLVEGEKVIKMADDLIDFKFSEKDSSQFSKLVTTVTPQMKAAVIRIPSFNIKNILKKGVIVILDNVQDPGNVGAILRICLGFNAGLILLNSADPTNPKVIRSSAGAIFQTPWIKIPEADISSVFPVLKRPIYRLEKRSGSKSIDSAKIKLPIALIAGSEGRGIKIKTKDAKSLHIPHNKNLESLNVANALAIALYSISTK